MTGVTTTEALAAFRLCRDAFKWDLLHFLATEVEDGPAPVAFVPVLALDGPDPRDGQIHHVRFHTRPAPVPREPQQGRRRTG